MHHLVHATMTRIVLSFLSPLHLRKHSLVLLSYVFSTKVLKGYHILIVLY